MDSKVSDCVERWGFGCMRVNCWVYNRFEEL